jgi:hypothetical protein
VDHFDPAENDAGTIHGLETKHGSEPPLDGTMILFDTIVEVPTLPDPDQSPATPAARGMAGEDSDAASNGRKSDIISLDQE